MMWFDSWEIFFAPDLNVIADEYMMMIWSISLSQCGITLKLCCLAVQIGICFDTSIESAFFSVSRDQSFTKNSMNFMFLSMLYANLNIPHYTCDYNIVKKETHCFKWQPLLPEDIHHVCLRCEHIRNIWNSIWHIYLKANIRSVSHFNIMANSHLTQRLVRFKISKTETRLGDVAVKCEFYILIYLKHFRNSSNHILWISHQCRPYHVNFLHRTVSVHESNPIHEPTIFLWQYFFPSLLFPLKCTKFTSLLIYIRFQFHFIRIKNILLLLLLFRFIFC